MFDSEPRELDPEQLAGLALLAARTVDVFEVRLRGRELALSQMENQAVQAELERSNERLASFAGQVSHDLKTPLTTLSLSLSLIREQLEDGQVVAESAPLLDRAINVSARMADLIDDVLDYARLGGTFRATEVDLDFVLGKVLEDLAPELADVTLHIGQLPTVLGDRAQLAAVLQNLLGNAARYRSDERPLEVRVARRHVQRASADRDHRQEQRRTARRTAPRLRATRRVDDSIEGTGIGLVTCRRIVGAHGGRIGIDASVTEGARFWFELPGLISPDGRTPPDRSCGSSSSRHRRRVAGQGEQSPTTIRHRAHRVCCDVARRTPDPGSLARGPNQGGQHEAAAPASHQNRVPKSSSRNSPTGTKRATLARYSARA